MIYFKSPWIVLATLQEDVVAVVGSDGVFDVLSDAEAARETRGHGERAQTDTQMAKERGKRGRDWEGAREVADRERGRERECVCV